jgi:hypothetical protein
MKRFECNTNRKLSKRTFGQDEPDEMSGKKRSPEECAVKCKKQFKSDRFEEFKSRKNKVRHFACRSDEARRARAASGRREDQMK